MPTVQFKVKIHIVTIRVYSASTTYNYSLLFIPLPTYHSQAAAVTLPPFNSRACLNLRHSSSS